MVRHQWEVTKTKHPNKGHTPNNGQRPMYQSVRYSESPLYSEGLGFKSQLDPRFYPWIYFSLSQQKKNIIRCTMPLTNINSDWMFNASSGTYIIFIYVGPLVHILGCNLHMLLASKCSCDYNFIES